MDKIYFGQVIWFNVKRGYGFIDWNIDGVKQRDIFCHFTDIVCEGFKTLLRGQKVSFKIGQNFHGDPKAIEITIVN
jgi:CspA family cold shock protein